jgi:hypothetical protein
MLTNGDLLSIVKALAMGFASREMRVKRGKGQ